MRGVKTIILIMTYIEEIEPAPTLQFFQAEDGIRDTNSWLEFRRVLFR
eukprot:COSAG03_NODE_24096_length_275_cov_0.426136_1_plen_47_part_10